MFRPCICAGLSQNIAGVEEKSDLMIGNESDSGYDCTSISTYEILIVACSPCGIPACLMR
jgi:hypothetical protein